MYCSIDDILLIFPESELIQITNDSVEAETYDSNVVNRAIDDAVGLINGYIRNRYSVPLVDVPSEIRRYTSELAIFFLHTRRFAQDMPEHLLKQRDFIISELGKIQKGIITLGIDTLDGSQVQAMPKYLSNKQTEDRVFTKDVLKRF